MNAPGHERYGRIDIQVHERRLLVDGRAVHLGSRAFDLLAALVARRDRVVPKDELIEQVWPGLVVEDNNLQVQISALRKALGAQTIATVPGRGYRFVAAAATVGGPAQTAPLDPHAHPRAAGRRSRLLVVDDNRLNRLLLCRALELMGHEVETAVDGRAALERLRTEPIDLLLLDLEMPELDGFELLELRAADPVLREIPVIVTSALEGAAHVARCIELGADDYLHKPPNPMLLKARVDASLERKHLRDRERELLARLRPGAPPHDGGASARRVAATSLYVALDELDAVDARVEPAAAALERLGDWSTLVLDAIEGRRGLVTQLGGDHVGAVFGATGDPAPGGASDAAVGAVAAASEMRELLAEFNREGAATGRAPLVARIGLASGQVMVGEAGTARRAAYVCVGAPVRRAARLQALAAQREVGLLLDAATATLLDGRIATEALPGHAGDAGAFMVAAP